MLLKTLKAESTATLITRAHDSLYLVKDCACRQVMQELLEGERNKPDRTKAEETRLRSFLQGFLLALHEGRVHHSNFEMP